MPTTKLTAVNESTGVDREYALYLSGLHGTGTFELFSLSNAARLKYRGNRVDLCSIVNAKSGACPEDCAFCSQSLNSKTGVKTYPLLDRERILDAALAAKNRGVRRFCIVTSGRKASEKEIGKIGDCISAVRQEGLLPCATLGMVDENSLRHLKDAGLHRYHHNLETAEAFFSQICTTHTYRDKIRTIEAARSIGLSLCSGGIFGMGESWEDRIDMAFALKEIGVDSVPVNFLTPVSGTPLENRDALSPMEALKIIAIYRLILPACEVRVCGGRQNALRDLHPFIFQAGADGVLIGNYLTTSGRDPEEDLQMIRDMGLEV